jgi:hypothetical protein
MAPALLVLRAAGSHHLAPVLLIAKLDGTVVWPISTHTFLYV